MSAFFEIIFISKFGQNLKKIPLVPLKRYFLFFSTQVLPMVLP